MNCSKLVVNTETFKCSKYREKVMVAVSHGRDIRINLCPHHHTHRVREYSGRRRTKKYGLVFRESSVAKSTSALSENRDLISGTRVLTQRTTTPKFERF